MEETTLKHFLFHIFRIDKENSPMPEEKKYSLMEQLRIILSNLKGEKNGKRTAD